MSSRRQIAELKVKDTIKNVRGIHSADEKTRIVLEGLRGEINIEELCRKEGINSNLYFNWSKEFLDAGKNRLNGESKNEMPTNEILILKKENMDLKQLVAELTLEVRMLKKM